MRLPWITITRTGTAVLLIAATFASTGGPRAEAQAVQQAPAKTPASAFAFIAATVGDGSWRGDAEYCNRDGCDNEEPGAVTAVWHVGGTYCKIMFRMRNNAVPSLAVARTVNLASTLKFDPYNGSSIYFAGPVVRTNGTTDRSWQLYYPSYDVSLRVDAALKYLQEQCAPKSPW